MKVLHVIPSLDPADGGPSVAMPMLARAVVAFGYKVTVVTTEPKDQTRQVIGDQLSVSKPKSEELVTASSSIGEQGAVGVEYIYTRRSTEFYKISWELVRWLKVNVRNFDLVHIHALFSFSSTAAALVAAKNKVPYIVRPLGVLNRWGLENRRAILKRASIALLEKRILYRAAAIHYTSEAEKAEACNIGDWVKKLHSFVIPLPVATPHRVIGDQLSVIREEFLQKHPQASGKQVVLFLSRIDPKKGIELLLTAFASVRKEIENVVLVIAGSGDAQYETFLRGEAEQLGISADVIWTGFVSGEEKAAVLAAAGLFVLPSYSENFGIAAAEALAAGVPTILSDQVALAEEASHASAAVIVPCDAGKIANAMAQLLHNPGKCAEFASAGKAFAKKQLSMTSIGELLQAQYRSILKVS